VSEAIVVTGVGLVTPLGTGTESVWQAWTRGESGIRVLAEGDSRLTRGIDPSPLPEIGCAGFVRDFEPRDHVEHGSLRRMDWCSRMLVSAARLATRDAGWNETDETALARTAIVVGSQFGNQRETARYTRRLFEVNLGAGSPLLFPNLVLNAPAGYAAIELGITGPNLTVSEHEASGEAALAAARDLLASGACDRAVVGGVDEFGEVYLSALAERRLLDPRSETRPRRSSRGWVVPGEGAAVILLERDDGARRRAAKPYAVLEDALIVGSHADPYRLPDPEAAARVLTEVLGARAADGLVALEDGGAARRAIDVRCREALGRISPRVALAGFRAQTGDWGSAGMLGVGLAALALRRGELPDAKGGTLPVHRIALVGAARSGVIAPAVLRSAT
jgi:3-oxoacyl-[acyl-carrier-protein] synthase II